LQTTKIPGPAGLLEVSCSPGDGDAWAILCHPHPLYGGSMDDAVLDIVRDRVRAAGGGAVTFNFRGVGSSEGRHDGGTGEVDDVVAVADWLESNYTVDALTLIGYSFGSSVAWRALPRLPRRTPAVLIAPPFGAMAYPRIPGATGAVIVGDQDPYVDAEALLQWLACHAGMRRMDIAEADHFLAGARDALGVALDEAISTL
jgi:hypothetical protein